MDTRVIAAKLMEIYGAAIATGKRSFDCGVTRTQGSSGTIFLEDVEETLSITRNELADNGAGDKLSSEIWHWIKP